MTSRTSKVEAIASHVLDGYLLLREKVALLEPMLFDPSVVNARGKGFSGRGFNTLKHSLFLGCVQDIANLCLDGDSRAPSILNVARALRDEPIRRGLRNKFADWGAPLADPETDPLILEALKRIELREQSERQAQFDDLYQEFQVLWTEISESPVLNAFRHIRDKVSAHTEIRQVADTYAAVDLSTLGIKWGDIGGTARKIQRLVELCGLLVRNTGFAWDALEVQLKRTASGFWLGEPGAR
jgi:hypothetical protein